jgi:hypothetical protein
VTAWYVEVCLEVVDAVRWWTVCVEYSLQPEEKICVSPNSYFYKDNFGSHTHYNREDAHNIPITHIYNLTYYIVFHYVNTSVLYILIVKYCSF